MSLGRHVENRLKVDKHGSGFIFQIIFSFAFREKKNLSPNFGVMVFLDLVDFQSTGSWDFSSLFFDKRPLNVGRHIEDQFKIDSHGFG